MYENMDRKTIEPSLTDKPSFSEYIATSSREGLPLSSDIGNRRNSADPILGIHEAASVDYPWPLESRGNEGAKRHTIHDTWSVQRDLHTPHDERGPEKLTLEPVSSDFDWEAGKAV
jgi:hypothetical protein